VACRQQSADHRRHHCAITANQGNPAPDVQRESQFAHNFKSSTGDLVEGAGDVVGLVANPLNAATNAALGTDLSTDFGASLRGLTGLPDDSPGLVKAMNTGGIGAGRRWPCPCRRTASKRSREGGCGHNGRSACRADRRRHWRGCVNRKGPPDGPWPRWADLRLALLAAARLCRLERNGPLWCPCRRRAQRAWRKRPQNIALT
jgi:hypothetical protein